MTPGDMARIHALCSGETRAWSADEFTDLLSGFGVFVCSGPSGFAIGRVIAPEVELLLIATHPDAQRQGLGRARLAAFVRPNRAWTRGRPVRSPTAQDCAQVAENPNNKLGVTSCL